MIPKTAVEAYLKSPRDNHAWIKQLSREHLLAEIGDVLTIEGNPWLVIAKEPPFEQRRIERLVCTPGQVMHRRGPL